MDIKRFEELAEAYGGDIARWPTAEQTGGRAYLAADPDAARAALARAADLDEALDAWRVPHPSMALRDTVLAAAPRARPARAAGSPMGLWLWLSGAGFAAAAVAGVIVGIAASDAAFYDMRADTVLSAAPPAEADQGLAPYAVGDAGSQRA